MVAISASRMPRDVAEGVPSRTPDALKGGRGSSGIAFLFRVIDEEAFARAFFRQDSPFANFNVSRLDSRTVSYRGNFRGDRKALETDLPGKTYGDFRISNVFWFNELLEIQARGTVRC